MNIKNEKQLDIESLKKDMVNYFSTAINPFDADLIGLEEIENLSEDKLIEIAKNNGFNLSDYTLTSYNLKE